MTAVMCPLPPPGGHFVLPSPAPRQGILLNRSPSSSAPNSPKKYAAHLIPRPSSGGPHSHPHPSSQSSASSSTSSTDDLNSSTSATSGPDVLSPAAESSKGPVSKTAPSSRRIRFAPLPTTDRDYDDDPTSPGFWADNDSAQSSPHASVIGFLSPPPLPQVSPPTPTARQSSVVAVVQAQSHASSSTLGLSLTDSSDHPDSGLSTETNTIAGSECGTDDTHTATGCRQRPKWARLLRLPKAAPLSKPSGGLRSPDADPSSSSAVNLSRCNSRESTVSLGSMRGGFFGWASLSDNGSSTSLGNPLSRRKTHGASESLPASPAIRGTLPLKPVTSERGTMSTSSSAARTKPRAGSNASSGSNTAQSQAGPVRRGTRLLNGRIYGAKRQQQGFQQKNPFANVHDDAEFVEWGHGGMGSTKSVGGKTNYAVLQSSNKLSIGHVEGGRATAEDDDDGSGMGWVKRRREQREREKKEKEEKERLEKVATGDGDGEVKSTNDEIAPPSSTETTESTDASTAEEPTTSPSANNNTILTAAAALVDSPHTTPSSPSPDAPPPPTPQPQPQPRSRLSADERERDRRDREKDRDRDRDRDKEYVYTAVTVPAPRPHHHHHHSQSQSHSAQSHSHPNSNVNSAMPSPTREFSSGSLASVAVAVGGVPGPSPLGLTGMMPTAAAAVGNGGGDAGAGATSGGPGSEGRKVTVAVAVAVEVEAASPSPPESSSSASSSFDGDGEEYEDASGEKDEDVDVDVDADGDADEKDEEDEDEVALQMRAKMQADAAGVEKISRHKPEKPETMA